MCGSRDMIRPTAMDFRPASIIHAERRASYLLGLPEPRSLPSIFDKSGLTIDERIALAELLAELRSVQSR